MNTEELRVALTIEQGRLVYVLSNGAFLHTSVSDAGVTLYQLMTQDEDENYHVLSGADRFFTTPQAAVDAAILAK